MTLKTPPPETPALYAQDGAGMDALVYAHYFVGGCDWYITEWDPATGEMFGWACLGDPQNAELGYIDHSQLSRIRVGGVFPVDFETDWTPKPLRECINGNEGER